MTKPIVGYVNFALEKYIAVRLLNYTVFCDRPGRYEQKKKLFSGTTVILYFYEVD